MALRQEAWQEESPLDTPEGEVVEAGQASPDVAPEGILEHATEFSQRIFAVLLRAGEAGDIEETALPALRLHLFNYLLKHKDADDADLEKEFTRINRLSSLEREFASEGNPLPTIGIEIELPKTQLTPEIVKVLNTLEIQNEDAIDRAGLLWEVNPSFSYSPSVQSRVLEELAVIGAVPLATDAEGGTSRVPKEEAFSLHVNFGIPPSIDGAMLMSEEATFFLLNDCLTYAFASSERLLLRKTSTSIHLAKSAEKSKKIKNKEKEMPGEEDGGYYSQTASGLRRVELRAMEFRDYPTFRMLSESQKLMAMLFGHLEHKQGIKQTPSEKAIAKLWSAFATEVSEYFSRRGLKMKMIDGDLGKQYVARMLEESDLKEWCRSIIQRYAAEVTVLLKPEVEIGGEEEEKDGA